MGRVSIFIAVFFFCLTGNAFSQTEKIDSLLLVLQDAQTEKRVDLLIELAQTYRNTNLDEGLASANEALVLAQKIGYKEGEAGALLNKGRLLRQGSDYSDAMEHFLLALRIYEASENRLQIAYVYNDIAFCYYDLDQPEKLVESLNSALVIFEEIEDEKGIADVTNNLGVSNDLLGRFDSAVVYYERSLKMNLKIGAKEEAANCRLNLAAVYTVQEKYEEAIKLIEQARAYYVESDNSYAQIIVFIELANLSSAKGDFSSAINYAEQAYEAAKTYGSVHKEMNISSHLINYYSKLNDGSNAYKYFKIYDDLKDSIFNENSAKLLTEAETRYETELKEQQIEVLNQTNKQEKFRRNAFAALSALILIVGLLLINRKRNEAMKNRLLYDKGQEVERMKSSFFANMTHEFRTPLTLILGPIELLKEKITSKEERKQLDVMEKNASRLLDLINQLLDLSKLESGKMNLQEEPLDIVLLIKRISGLFESAAEIKKIKLTVESSLENSLCQMDADKIEKVFVNLISNALKYTPVEGSILISIKNTPSQDIQIQIKDNGQGIQTSDLEHIFDQYFQSDKAADYEYSGTGIGLSLSKELVELHGGSITVSSTMGKGTEFTLIFPHEIYSGAPISVNGGSLKQRLNRRIQTSESVAVSNASADAIKKSDEVPLVLLVEDNQEVRDYVKDVVSADYRIVTAEDGQQGYEKALQLIPDLIISDVMMPGMNGLELCEKLKSDEKTNHIPILLLTARAAVEDRIEGLEHKADAYLAKPFVPKELQVRISNLIENRLKVSEKYSREIVLQPGVVSVESVDDLFLEKLKTFIEKNLDNEMLGVDDLAGELHMSRSQLHRKMKALTNLPPNEFIRSYRLVRAMELIKSNAGSTAEIAFNVGFNSPSYFTRCFREYYGFPPSEARSQHS